MLLLQHGSIFENFGGVEYYFALYGPQEELFAEGQIAEPSDEPFSRSGRFRLHRLSDAQAKALMNAR